MTAQKSHSPGQKTTTDTILTQDPTGLAVSDFEPCYLPTGDILFNSSRCFGQVVYNFIIVSNLFLMNKDGKYLRRIGYDQDHTPYPTMMSAGNILYSRFEYNDRNPSHVLGLFTMNIDGTHQTEYYGNQTSIPSTLLLHPDHIHTRRNFHSPGIINIPLRCHKRRE
jgi:hypothetical protein